MMQSALGKECARCNRAWRVGRALPGTPEAWREEDYCGGSKATADLSRVKKDGLLEGKPVKNLREEEKAGMRQDASLLCIGVEKGFGH